MQQHPNNTLNESASSIVSQETKALRQEVITFCEAVQEVIITNESEYLAAGEITKVIAGLKKRSEERRIDELKYYIEAENKINEYFKPFSGSLAMLQKKIGNAIFAWQQKLAKERAEEQRRINEENRKKEADRKKAAEKARKEAEELRKKAESTGDQSYIYDAEAQEEAAMAAEFEDFETTPVIAAPPPAKIDGVHFRYNWTADITDDFAFVRHCIKNNLYDYLSGDVKKLRAEAKKIKRDKTFPGARIYQKRTIVSKS